MVETLRYSRLLASDVDYGFGNAEVRLADQRVVTGPQFHVGHVLLHHYASLPEALADAQNRLVLVDTPMELTANLTIPATAALGFAYGGYLTVPAGVTLTLRCPVHAGYHRLFYGDGTVDLSQSPAVAHPSWWGATGDGTTDDTAALTRMMASQPRHVLTSHWDTYYTDALTISHRIDLVGGGTFKTRTANNNGLLQFGTSASKSRIDLRINNNNLHGTGIKLSSLDDVQVTLFAENWQDGASGGSSDSCVVVSGGDNNHIVVDAQSMSNTGNASGSNPRVVSVQNDASNTYVRCWARECYTGVVVGESTDTLIDQPMMQDLDDNGVYCVADSVRCTVQGGVIRNVAEPLVFKGDDHVVNGTVLRDVPIGIGFEDMSNLTIQNVRMTHSAGFADPNQFCRARSGNGTSTGIRIDGCIADTIIGTGRSMLGFNTGTVNNVHITNSRFLATWIDGVSSFKELLTLTTANRWSFLNNHFETVDQDSVLIGSDVFVIALPTVSTESTWKNNQLHPGGSAIFRVTGMWESQTYLHHEYVDGSVPALLDYKNSQTQGKKVMQGTAAPTAGAWTRGDFVRNVNTTAGSTQSIAGATPEYVLFGWICTTTGTPGTWKECRVLTGS
jgi:hypothetical protein